MKKKIKNIVLDASRFIIYGYEGVLFEGTQKELIEECKYSFHMKHFTINNVKSQIIGDTYYVYLS